MKVLKGFAIGLLSFLLSLSLFALGLAVALNSTVLSPRFVHSEVEKVGISSLADDFLSQSSQSWPNELRASLISAVTKLEPRIKQEIGAGIDQVYDYLLGKSQSLDMALVLKSSILKPDLVASFVNELDLTSLGKQLIAQQVNLPIGGDRVSQYVDKALAESEPEFKKQIIAVIPAITDYLLGESQSLNATISLEPIINKVRDTVREDFLKSPPPELSIFPRDMLPQLFDQYFAEFMKDVPLEITLDESMFRSARTGIAEALETVTPRLMQVREYVVGYFQPIFKGLIGFTILLVIGIILINRQVRGSSRAIGVTFVTCGAIELAGVFLAKYFADRQLAQLSDIPAQIQALFPELVNDVLAPLQMFSLGVLIAGVVLLIVSHAYRPKTAQGT